MSIVKKIFFLSLIILILSLLLWGVYNLSFKKPALVAENTNQEENAPPQNSTIKKVPEKIRAITDEAVIGPVLIPGDNALKYYTTKGQVFRIDMDGQNKISLSSKELPGLTHVSWSPDQNKVITKFIGADGQHKFYFYDYTTEKGTPLKKNIDEIVWQSNANRILYKYYDEKTKKRSLNIADPDGSNWTKLADIDYRNISIAQLPKSGLVSFWNSPDTYAQTMLQSVPLIGGEKKMIYQEKFGADYLWSKDGNMVLVSSADQRAGSKMQLAVMNYNGGEYRNLDIPTFVSKCVWSKDGKTIYYALPGNIPVGSILPNEYAESKFRTADTFWKINLIDGKKTRILETTDIKNAYDATGLFLNEDESALFFINKADSKVYRIDI